MTSYDEFRQYAAFQIDFANTGEAGACFQVRSGNGSTGPWTYTIEAEKSLSDTWHLLVSSHSAYDLAVYRPNGFLRTFKGRFSELPGDNLEVSCACDRFGWRLVLVITNHGAAPCRVITTDAYTGQSASKLLAAGARLDKLQVSEVELWLV